LLKQYSAKKTRTETNIRFKNNKEVARC